MKKIKLKKWLLGVSVSAIFVAFATAVFALRNEHPEETPEIIISPREEVDITHYLMDELKWEIGDISLTERNFFSDQELVKNVPLEFVAPIEDVLWKKGKHVVKIKNGNQVVEAHLHIVDTTPPTITVPETKEYELGSAIRYKEDVAVEDNSGEEMELLVDYSAVVANMAGSYEVCYSAVDSSGNVAREYGTIVIKPGKAVTEEVVNVLAQEILKSLVTEDMTLFEQAGEIFFWCKENIKYSVDANKSGIMEAAYEGMYYKTGDCYTYFATAAYLMDKCGITNLPVSHKMENGTHYWSLVNVGSGWYHFDCSVNAHEYDCFMQTDEQVLNYAKDNLENTDYYEFDEEDMPQREKQIIFE